MSVEDLKEIMEGLPPPSCLPSPIGRQMRSILPSRLRKERYPHWRAISTGSTMPA